MWNVRIVKLRTRFANRLSSDDADGHPFFDHRTGGHIHAVATTTNT